MRQGGYIGWGPYILEALILILTSTVSHQFLIVIMFKGLDLLFMTFLSLFVIL